MATKSPISGQMALQPIFATTSNLESNINKEITKNPPFRIKLMAKLHNASLATDK